MIINERLKYNDIPKMLFAFFVVVKYGIYFMLEEARILNKTIHSSGARKFSF